MTARPSVAAFSAAVPSTMPPPAGNVRPTMSSTTIPRMLRRTLPFALSGVLLLLSSGCYLSTDGKSLERRVLQVEEQQAEFVSTFARTRDELTTLVHQADQQVAALRETLEEARTLLGRSSANLGAQVDGLENNLKMLQGRLDEQRFGYEELQRTIDTLRTDTEFRLEQLER